MIGPICCGAGAGGMIGGGSERRKTDWLAVGKAERIGGSRIIVVVAQITKFVVQTLLNLRNGKMFTIINKNI